MKLSNFAGWKNSLEFLWCRYNSIPLYGTQLSILSAYLQDLPFSQGQKYEYVASRKRKMFLEVLMYFLLVCHAKMYEIYTGYISRVVDIWWMFIRYSQCVRYGDLRRAPRSFTHLLLITLSQMRGRSKMSIICFKSSHHYFCLL